MESSELVFSVIDTMSEPVLVLENNESGVWLYSYANQFMNKLLNTASESEPSEDTAKKDLPEIDSSLIKILKSYEELASDSCTLNEVEVFGAIYNIHFNKNEKYLFANFIEIKPSELFDNISFNDLSGACNAIVVILDNMGSIVDINECFSNIVGMKKEEALGKSFFETFIPGNIETLNHHLGELLKKDVYNQQFVTPLKGERENLYRINWQVSKVVRHEQTYIIAVGSDITKFVEENSELKKQLTNIKVGFDYFPLAVGYMDEKGLFTKMNHRFEKMFRIPETHDEISFDKIALFKKHIGFEKMNENIQLIKEMSYKIDFNKGNKVVKLKVDIRLLSGKKESSKLYIVVAQKVD